MKVGVIGAGISGLVCARALKKAGHQVMVLEKSKSLGGRCATRKFGDHVVDHGVQYFTLRDPQVRSEVESVAGVELQKLTAPILQAEPKGAVYREGEERFYLRSGNNRLGKRLAEGLEVVPDPLFLYRRHAGSRSMGDRIHRSHLLSLGPWMEQVPPALRPLLLHARRDWYDRHRRATGA